MDFKPLSFLLYGQLGIYVAFRCSRDKSMVIYVHISASHYFNVFVFVACQQMLIMNVNCCGM